MQHDSLVLAQIQFTLMEIEMLVVQLVLVFVEPEEVIHHKDLVTYPLEVEVV